jgi:uncharacterized protein YqeY
MKSIQEQVTNILQSTRNQDVKNALRIVKAEFQREREKTISDGRALKIIRGLIKSEQERIKHIDVFKKGNDKDEAIQYIHILTGFLPSMVGEETIRDWILDNIDFSDFKKPIMAMKFIMEHFGDSADGGTVRAVIAQVHKEQSGIMEKLEKDKAK